MANNDQRLQFEYIPTHSIFSDLNFHGSSNNSLQKANLSIRQEDFQNFIASFNTVTTSEAPAEATTSIVECDDEFSPKDDGEIEGCRKCGVEYSSSTELKLHFGAVHSRQTFECCVCNKLFIRRHGFLVHIKKYHDYCRNYPCHFCQNIFTTEEALAEHCNQFHKEPMTICPLCGLEINEGGMKFHIDQDHSANVVILKEEHLPSNQPTATGDEEMTFIKEKQTSKKSVMASKRSVNKTRHNCPFCSYETNRAERLRVHIRGKHQNFRPYPCMQCDKEFKQKDKLNRHILSVHESFRKYKCSSCDTSFSRKDELLRHDNIVHLGNKNLYNNRVKSNVKSNEESVQTFSLKAQDEEQVTSSYNTSAIKVKIPEDNYTVERPHGCNFCEKRFKVKDKLNLHINTVSRQAGFFIEYNTKFAYFYFSGTSQTEKFRVSVL